MMPFKEDPFRPYADQRREWFDLAVAYTGDDCIMWPFDLNIQASKVLRGYGSVKPGWLICTLVHGPSKGKPWPMADCPRGAEGCINPKHVAWRSSKERGMIIGKRRRQKKGEPYE
jgi:hypothetical protein